MNEEGIRMLRKLAGYDEEPPAPKPEPPRFKPVGYYIRRTDPIDRTYMRYRYSGRPSCTS